MLFHPNHCQDIKYWKVATVLKFTLQITQWKHINTMFAWGNYIAELNTREPIFIVERVCLWLFEGIYERRFGDGWFNLSPQKCEDIAYILYRLRNYLCCRYGVCLCDCWVHEEEEEEVVRAVMVDEEDERVAWLPAVVARWWLWLDYARGVVICTVQHRCCSVLRRGWHRLRNRCLDL